MPIVIHTPKLFDFAGVIYLASPYTSTHPPVMEDRLKRVSMAAGYLMRNGYIAFSPIAHSCNVAKFNRNVAAETWEFWEPQCLSVLARCEALFVLQIPGTADSVGVNAEIAFAEENSIPVYYMQPLEYGGYIFTKRYAQEK